jgi:hypothetical protein
VIYLLMCMNSDHHEMQEHSFVQAIESYFGAGAGIALASVSNAHKRPNMGGVEGTGGAEAAEGVDSAGWAGSAGNHVLSAAEIELLESINVLDRFVYQHAVATRVHSTGTNQSVT